MMEIVLYQTALTDDCLNRRSGEQERVRLQEIPPMVGETVSMGAERLWTVVDVDAYSNGQQSVFIAHVALDAATVGDRSTWYFVQSLKRRPLTNLRLFFSEDGQFLQFAENMTGEALQPGLVLPKFDVQNHGVSSQPWGVAKVDTFLSKESEKELSYSMIHVAQCAYIPEFADTPELAAVA
jgi:hypothetical protein